MKIWIISDQSRGTGHRRRGKPRCRWSVGVKETLAKRFINLEDSIERASDTCEWGMIVG